MAATCHKCGKEPSVTRRRTYEYVLKCCGDEYVSMIYPTAYREWRRNHVVLQQSENR